MNPPDHVDMTIKKVPRETRETIVRIAQARGQSVATLLAEAVPIMAGLRARDQVQPPRPTGPASALDLGALAQVMNAAAAAANASGRPMPKTVAGHAFALLGQHLRQQRGLPPLVPRTSRPVITQSRIAETALPGHVVEPAPRISHAPPVPAAVRPRRRVRAGAGADEAL